jgi:SdrD B-like domain
MFQNKYSFPSKLSKIFVASVLTVSLSLGSLSILKTYADASTTTPGITIVKLFDGSAPFDSVAGNGNDTGNNNAIVRAGQVTAYKFELSLNDPNAGTPTPYNNFKFVSDPLPLGFRWQSLPLLCSGVASAITGDGITTQSVLTCDTGTKNTGDVFSVQAAVFTLPTVIDNSVLSFGAATSVTGSTNTATATAPVVTATVLPKIDVQKSGAQFFASKNIGGVDGFVYVHGLGIKLKPGSEIPTLPLTLTDDVSAINPNAKFVGCGVSGTQSSVIGGSWVYSLNMPLGKTGQYSAWPNNADNSVKDSGTISCPTQAGNEQVANITINNVDTMTSTFPTLLFPYNSPVSPGDNWIGSYYTMVWIPASEFNAGNSYNFIGTNKYNDFNPTGAISGAQNFNDFTLEPGRGIDNNATASQTALTNTEDWYTQIYYRPGPGSFEKYDYRFNDAISAATFYGDTTSGSIWGGYVGSSLKTGDGVMGTNGSYTSLLVNYYNGVIDIPAGFISCSTIDTSKVSIAPLPGHPTRGAFNFSYGPQDSNSMHGIAVEYGIGGAGGAGTGWASTNDMKTSTCDNSDSTGGVWYNDITAVPGGIDKITKVRFRVTDTWTVAEQLALMASTGVPNVYSYGAVHLKVKLTANPGDVAPNYAKFKDPSGNWFAGWYQSAYDSTTGLGAYGDRITVVGTRVRVAKTINDPITESQVGLTGSTKTFYLTSTSDAMGITPAGDSVNVKIVDTVPSGLSYTVGSASCIDTLPAIQAVSCQPNVVVNSNGTTTLTWDFGTFTAGSAITKMKYDVTVDSTVADGVSLINTATISADNDNSLEAWRTDTATATVINPSAFAVQKKVLTPLVPIGDQIVYRLIAKNTGAVTVDNTDFIDWLPWNGDSRTPASSFTGNINFTSLANISGVPATSIEFTKYNRTSLSLPADLDPQTANSTIIWCGALSGGACPANNSEVTGFRIKTGAMTSGQGTEFELIVTPDASVGDSAGNIITNRFKGRVDGLTLPIESNNVFATVVGGTIGDTIYWDKSGNGIQDVGEVGIPGVAVKLVDPVTGDPVDCSPEIAGVQPCTAITDSNGKYKFENLKFGNYKIVATPPAGYAPTGEADSTLDNQTILTVSNTSTAARTNLTGDFGYKGTASWGDRVWLDTNADQIQDPTESNITGAEVTSLEYAGFDGIFGNADDVTFPSQLSQNLTAGDSLGSDYKYSDLPPGNYRSTVNPIISGLPGASLTTPAVVTHTITPGEQFVGADYGFTLVGKLGDTVYLDINNNGMQDVGEPGIQGVVVTLKDGSGNNIDSDPIMAGVQPTTATTNASGKYEFDKLANTNYTVVVTPPTLYPVNSGDVDGTKDSSTVLGITPTAQTNLTGDFGYTGTASFGDKVYLDANSDGINQATETGIQGAVITLTYLGADGVLGGGDDFVVGTKTTGVNGEYLFENLPAGKYSASVDTATVPNKGITTPTTNSTTLTNGQAYVGGDFGFNTLGSISGFTYVDTNFDGVNSSGDKQLGGVTVTLTGTNANGTITPIIVTSDPITGAYTFPNLIPGTYTVTETQPSGYSTGSDNIGTGAGTQGTITANKQTGIILGFGENSINNNFGELASKITGSVYLNPDNNGTQGAGEPNGNIPAGTTVTITDGTNTYTATINPDGTYSQNVLPGTYTVTVNPPAGYVVSTSTELGAGTGANPTSVTVASGETKSQGKDGLYKLPDPSSISGYNYVDANNDGIKQAAEAPIAGTLVTLSGPGLVTPLTITTGADGKYEFLNLAPGVYSVTMSQPAVYNDGKDTVGTGASNQGSASTNDKITGVTLTSGNVSIDNNFGELPLNPVPSITGKVYFDLNQDGVQNANEPDGYPAGTIVTITNNADPLITFTAVINPDGTYSQNIPTANVGDYTVTVTPPALYSLSTSTETGSGTGANPTVVNVAAGQSRSQGKDGLYLTPVAPPITRITGVAYLNPDNNGIQDTNEPNGNIPAGTVVTITNGTNTYTAVLNPDGTYSQDVLPGTYTVTLTPPPGYTVSTSTQTGNGTGSNPTTVTVALGETKSQGKDGLYQAPAPTPGSISGYNYVDTNNNGIKDPGEMGIAGTTVTLTGPGLNDTQTVTTGPDGSYTFITLLPGTYTITMSQPSGYTDGQDAIGTGATNPGTLTPTDTITGIELSAAELSINNNFGEIAPAPLTTTITGSVYVNPDNNGTQGEGEPNGNIPTGTTVTITDVNDVNNTYTVTINPDGSYSQIVLPGTYIVKVNPPAGYTVSTSTELGAGTGSNPTTITTVAGETVSQGKDGLYKTPVVSGGSTIKISNTTPITSVTTTNSSSTTPNKLTPQIGIKKSNTGVTANNDGTYTAEYLLDIENLGQKDLENIYVYDYLGDAYYKTVYKIINVISDKFDINPDFNGISDKYISTTPSTIADKSTLPDATKSDANATVKTNNKLAIGEKTKIRFQIRFDPKDQTGPFRNSAGTVGYTREGERTEDDPPVDFMIDQSKDALGADVVSFNIPKPIIEVNDKLTTVRTGGNSSDLAIVIMFIMSIGFTSSLLERSKANK